MSVFLFQLGSNPELSLAELVSVCGPDRVIALNTWLAQVECQDEAACQLVFSQTGGSVKCFEVISSYEIKSVTSEQLQTALVDELAKTNAKVQFGIAELGRDHLAPFDPSELKILLKERGIAARYIEGSRSGLSASVLLHHSKVIELMVANTQDKIWFARTIAVQDIDTWTMRDRAKPYADRKKGMLPPKVARMLVNLSRSADQQFNSAPDPEQPLAGQRVFDPFCGTGTVLLEAALLGAEVVGSDLDPDAVVGSQRNFAWLNQALHQTRASEWILSDVAHAQPKQLVDRIITEPFLGKQTPQTRELPGIFKGLEKLYLGAFKQWQRVLRPGGRVVIIMPRVTTDQQTYRLEALIDKLPGLGYTTCSEPIIYKRPMAIVEREVWVFEYQPIAN